MQPTVTTHANDDNETNINTKTVAITFQKLRLQKLTVYIRSFKRR